MFIKQLSVFVENKPGRLNAIVERLANAGVNLRALSIADTTDFGILRAIGASKKNISQVFNAETFIIGLFSGLIGIGITYLAIILINIVVHNLTGVVNVNAQLPLDNAFILVVLSVVLTLIGGIIPSKKAAKKDPVTALRSE